MISRRVTPTILINSKDATQDLSPYLKSISFTDELESKYDTLELELVDSDRLFIGDWFPPLGSTLKVTLTKKNFSGDGLSETFSPGEFEIDEVECSFPPSSFKIKAVSISQNSGLRQHDESKSWENVRLSEIAAQIAKAGGVTLFYEASDDPLINRAEQGEMSRLAFLEKLCRKYYLALKVTDKTLVIYDESKLDAQEPVIVFERDTSPILRFSARTTLQEVYKSCEVNYAHEKHDELYKGVFDSGKEKGKVLKINKKVDSQQEAEILAKNELRQKNKKENRLQLETVGDFCLLAGNVVELKSFGKFDGRYLIEKARHEIGNGYTARLELRRCLDY